MSEKKPMSKIKYFGLACVSFGLSLMLRFVYFSSKKRFTNENEIIKLFESNQNFILVEWHNRALMQYFGFRKFKGKHHTLTALISKSDDGALAHLTLGFLGVKSVRGSSSRGGTEALRAMSRIAKTAGSNLSITPDGPKGPVYEIKNGVLAAAKLTGLPILPVSWFAKNHKRVKTWDRLILARPFTVLHFVFGTPIVVPRKCTSDELEKIRKRLQAEMMRIGDLSKKMD